MLFYVRLRTSRGKETLFRGPSTSSRPTEAELRQIKVDIHRNLSGAVNASRELQREIVNPDDVIVKRRKGNFSNIIYIRQLQDNYGNQHSRLLLRIQFLKMH